MSFASTFKKLFITKETQTVIEADRLFSFLAGISHNPDAIENFLYRYNRLRKKYRTGEDKIFITLYLEWEEFIVSDQPANNRKYSKDSLHTSIRHEINVDKLNEDFRVLFLSPREQTIAFYVLFVQELTEYIQKEIGNDVLIKAMKNMHSDPLLAKIRSTGTGINVDLINSAVTVNEIDYPLDKITKSFTHFVAGLHAVIEKHNGEKEAGKVFKNLFLLFKNTYNAKIVGIILKIVPEKVLDFDDWLSLMSKQELERQIRQKTDDFEALTNSLEVKVSQRTQELQRAYEELKKLDSKKSEFVSIAAHQLRTPLSGLKWSLSMISTGDVGPVTAEQKDFLERGLGTTDKLIGIINDLLEIDLLVKDEVIYNIAPTDILPIIATAIHDLTPQARRSELTIIPPRVPKDTKIITEIDDAKISIVIQNLIDNAIKYSKKGGTIEVTVSKINTMVQIAIKDGGIGISKEDQEGIFERFFRASNAVRKVTEGSGIGLFVAKNLVEDHGGRIWFDSVEKEGTTFFITLPLLRNNQNQGLKSPFGE